MVLKNIFDVKLGKFIFVGMGSTFLSAVCMFMLYNLTPLGYWSASAIAYVTGGFFNFFMNKNFTFRSEAPVYMAAIRFVITTTLCYLVAYNMAKPLIFWVLADLSVSVSVAEQSAMLLGMLIFTILNYLSQCFFVFMQL